MIFPECKFDKVCDLCEVDQFGWINLAEVISNGTIPADIAVNEEAYNEIEDLGSIVGKPSDVFEAMQYGVSLNKSAAASKDASSKEGAD